LGCSFLKNYEKKPIKLMVETITWKIKGKARERPKDTQPTRTKEGKERVCFVVGSYFTTALLNVTCMQIVRFNNNKKYKTSISHQCNLLFYDKG